jgi:hypothetical protein
MNIAASLMPVEERDTCCVHGIDMDEFAMRDSHIAIHAPVMVRLEIDRPYGMRQFAVADIRESAAKNG